MDALTFLYWSLAVGFAILILFLVIALVFLIKILKDLSKTSGYVREAVSTVNDNVVIITEKVTSVAEQIAEYVVKPISVIQFLMEKVKPMIDMIQKKGEEWSNIVDAADDDRPSKKSKSGKKR